MRMSNRSPRPNAHALFGMKWLLQPPHHHSAGMARGAEPRLCVPGDGKAVIRDLDRPCVCRERRGPGSRAERPKEQLHSILAALGRERRTGVFGTRRKPHLILDAAKLAPSSLCRCCKTPSLAAPVAVGCCSTHQGDFSMPTPFPITEHVAKSARHATFS